MNWVGRGISSRHARSQGPAGVPPFGPPTPPPGGAPISMLTGRPFLMARGRIRGGHPRLVRDARFHRGRFAGRCRSRPGNETSFACLHDLHHQSGRLGTNPAISPHLARILPARSSWPRGKKRHLQHGPLLPQTARRTPLHAAGIHHASNGIAPGEPYERIIADTIEMLRNRRGRRNRGNPPHLARPGLGSAARCRTVERCGSLFALLRRSTCWRHSSPGGGRISRGLSLLRPGPQGNSLCCR